MSLRTQPSMRRRPRRAWRLSWLAGASFGLVLLATLAAITPSEAYARADWKRRETTIRNDRVALTVTRLTSSTRAQFELTSFETLGESPIRFDLSASPLFRAVLVSRDRPGQKPIEIGGPMGDGERSLPTRGLVIEPVSEEALEIRFHEIRIPNRTQRLSVRIRVHLARADGAAEWSADAHLVGKGDLAIGELQFPVLRVHPQGKSSDDHAVLPMTGGLVLRDPLRARTQKQLHVGPYGSASNFHYPGYIESQFLAYYDDDPVKDKATGGLYIAAEDPAGYLKSFYFEPAPDGDTFEMLIGHYNVAPDPLVTRRPTTAESLARIDLGDKLPYRVVTDLFHGDWYDAADLYRAWLDREKPPFLANGPLHSRTDIPASMQTLVYGIGFPLQPGERPLGESDITKNPDLATLRDVSRYFSDAEGRPMPSSLTILGDLSGTNRRGNANDARVRPLRDGLLDFLHHIVKSPWGSAIVSLQTNRDIGNWDHDPEDPAENFDRIQRVGLVLDWAGQAAGRNLRDEDEQDEDDGPRRRNVNRGITASCSDYVLEHRLAQFERSLGRTAHEGDNCLTGVVLSGRGGQAHLCYAPMYLSKGKGLEQHHHPIGGGTAFFDGYRKLVHALRERFRSTVDHLVPAGERSHEQLIDTSILAGRLRLEPWDRVFHGRSIWIEGARPIPLLSYLYHDYTLIAARFNRRSDVLKAYARGYDSNDIEGAAKRLLQDSGFLTLERQRFAAAVLEGRYLGVYIEAPALGEDAQRSMTQGGGERTWIDGPPSRVPGALETNYAFLREMMRLRHEAAPWLTLGRMLRPAEVRVPAGTIDLDVLVARRPQAVPVSRILSSAWRAPDGRIAVALVNYTFENTTLSLAFDPAEWDLAAGEKAKPVLRPAKGEPLALERLDDGRWRTPKFVITPDRPARWFVVEGFSDADTTPAPTSR